MGKWLAAILGTVLTTALGFWLTEGLKAFLESEPIHSKAERPNVPEQSTNIVPPQTAGDNLSPDELRVVLSSRYITSISDSYDLAMRIAESQDATRGEEAQRALTKSAALAEVFLTASKRFTVSYGLLLAKDACEKGLEYYLSALHELRNNGPVDADKAEEYFSKANIESGTI
jgi:hypothetical protein